MANLRIPLLPSFRMTQSIPEKDEWQDSTVTSISYRRVVEQVGLSNFRANTSNLFVPTLGDIDIIIDVKIKSQANYPHCDAQHACYLHRAPSGLLSDLAVQTMLLPKEWVVNSGLDEVVAEV